MPTPDTSAQTKTQYRGRFAPSPTGLLHFGSLLVAVGSWLRARSLGGSWIIRIEDIDPPRELPGAATAILNTLAAFGLHSDEPVLFQSQCREQHSQALQILRAAGHAFRCGCTRAEVALTGVHHGICTAAEGAPICWRLRVEDMIWQFDDGIAGKITQASHEVGDFVIWGTDDLPAYQLAVVVDDAAQGITEVVRGADLLDSTPWQIYLQRQLAYSTPNYLHLPLAVDNNGVKLSKSLASLSIDDTDPLPALRQVFAFLGQPSHTGIDSVDRLLSKAINTFDITRIPRLRSQMVI